MTMNRNYQKATEVDEDPMTNLGGLDHITKRPDSPTRIPSQLSGVSTPSGITPRPAPSNMMAGGFGSLGTNTPPSPGTFAPTPSLGSIQQPITAQKKPTWLRVGIITVGVAGLVYALSGFIGGEEEGE